MALTVRRQGGVVVEYAGEGVVFDPTKNVIHHPAFVSHAHADHAQAFRYKDLVKYTTEPTRRLLEVLGYKTKGEWRRLPEGGKVKIGEIEVRAHNAGHVLGSVQFEAVTPEGTILYTGDFDMGDSYTMQPAEPVNCDLLVIETTFGAPMFKFPKRAKVALEMVKWALLEAIPRGMVPTFNTDSIGNAQEVISIFNKMTKLPVVTVKSATKVSDVYREYGHHLEYVDADSEEGRELIESRRCTLIAPKRSRLSYGNLEAALASGWAVIMKRRNRCFTLSDHADFRNLLNFIRRCHPKRVLTFHGGAMTKDFANYVKNKLGIDAQPLGRREETLLGSVSTSQRRMGACRDQLLKTVRIPGFIYTNPWLVREMARIGFTQNETEAALQSLIERGILDLSGAGVKLGQIN